MPIKQEDLVVGAEFAGQTNSSRRVIKVVTDRFVIYTDENGNEHCAPKRAALIYWSPVPEAVRYVHWIRTKRGKLVTITTENEVPLPPLYGTWLRADKVAYTEGER